MRSWRKFVKVIVFDKILINLNNCCHLILCCINRGPYQIRVTSVRFLESGLHLNTHGGWVSGEYCNRNWSLSFFNMKSLN
ncbi:hypothetical protein FKM82_023386 [Ascaphus truei]